MEYTLVKKYVACSMHKLNRKLQINSSRCHRTAAAALVETEKLLLNIPLYTWFKLTG